MPVVNAKAVESAIRIGLALNCEIAEWCRFARKNYFYPDMPKNFQTSQYDEPIAFEGFMDVDIPTADGGTETFRVEIERAHMEEDTGKSLHVGGATGRIHGADHSLVDYNRAGIPLIEIVTKPIMGMGEKAPADRQARTSPSCASCIVALGVSDARMDQGSIRADVNLSLAPKGAGGLGTRSETKNVNSLRSVERAVRYEMQRHAGILDAGGSILQETRHWHEDTGITTSGREKSDAEDYRYFPEPDLVPVAPSREWVERAARHAAGEPDRQAARGCRPSGASPTSRCATPSEPARSAWSRRPSPPAPLLRPPASGGSRRWPVGPTSRASTSPTSASRRPRWPPCRPWSMPRRSTTSSPAQVFDGLIAGEGTPEEIVAERGLAVVSDDGALGAAVDAAIAANPDVADKIRDGKVAAAGALIGDGDEADARPGRRRSGARADPREADLIAESARLSAPTRADFGVQMRRLGEGGAG